jgi:glycerol uptake operon antiterminator
MQRDALLKLLCCGPVIPAPRTEEDYLFAVRHTSAPSIILLCGDINSLPELLAEAKKFQKRILIHIDLLEGVGKDKAGIKLLAKMGADGLITTKPHLCKMAHDTGLLVIQRLFIMDSEALRTGLRLLEKVKPDAVEVLPACLPELVVRQMIQSAGIPVLAGGLVTTRSDVANALHNGICAVSTSRRDLWALL